MALQRTGLPKILFVDDEPALLSAMRRKLHGDYQVETAASGAEGLEILNQKGPFMVVVSDMQMPAMNGAVFLRRARTSCPETVRILLTGHADLESAMNAVNHGYIFRLLTKPCDDETLRTALANAIEHYRMLVNDKTLLDEKLTQAADKLREADRQCSFANLAAGLGGAMAKLTTELQPLLEELRGLAQQGRPLQDRHLRALNALAEQLQLHGSELLSLSSLDQRKPTLVDVHSATEETLDTLRAGNLLKGVYVDLKVGDIAIFLQIDPRHLQQILVNLLVNAADAIRAGQTGVQQISIAWHRSADGLRVRCDVTDTGCGIAPQNMGRIFEPYFTTLKGKRGGLGLSVTKQIVDSYTGKITVQSKVGFGSTFSVELPSAV